MAARAVRRQARADGDGAARPAAEARLREPDPQGGHGHQQCRSCGDTDPRPVQGSTTQGTIRSLDPKNCESSASLNVFSILNSHLSSQCGRASVGDLIYRHMSFPGKFSPEYLLDCLEISSEHEALEAADRVEAAMHVWRRKASQRSPWIAVKDLMESDKNVMLARRAEDVLLCLKQRFPGLSQTTLDASKIQYNKVSKPPQCSGEHRHGYELEVSHRACDVNESAGCWASNTRELFEGAGEPSVQHRNMCR